MSNVVIVPTYNERENIRPLVEQLLALPIEIQVIVVDDNSPDGTGAIADELAASNSHVRVIHRSGKLGLGTAYVAGFKAALSMGADRILTMDADFSHHPRYVPDLVDRSRDADLVIGSRYVRGGGTRYCTLPRKALSWGANAFVKMVLWLQAMDCTAGFRCYRREVLESIDLDTIFSNGYSFLIEMLYRVQRRGWRVAEVPIIFENRRHGASKISRQEILRAMYTVVRLGMERLFSSDLPPAASQQR
ncbi:MAG: polyprenol monophosphomannose synthase [Chloroflexi bacterium]|nr:MAG: polyprenol monophosphomannose synthase [Chloroflexota bacterium]